MIERKVYAVTLTTIDPFRVGGKPDPLSETENAVAVVGGRVCVPGPSLKGALRGELERWLNDQYYDASKKQWKPEAQYLQPCIPAPKLTSDEQRLVDNGRFRGQVCQYPYIAEDRPNKGMRQRNADYICPVCYLLGAQGLPGFVSVPFLFSDMRYDELYSARLERTSRTVVRGTNRSYQLIPPETVFKGEMTVVMKDSLLGWELGLQRILSEPGKGDAWLANGSSWTQDKVLNDLVLNRLRAITHLGGYRSKGFGRVKIEVSELPSQKRA